MKLENISDVSVSAVAESETAAEPEDRTTIFRTV
jgi:hypothetical protein